MANIPDQQQIKEAYETAIKLHEQNSGLFGTERVQQDLIQYGFKRHAVYPAAQQVFFIRIQKAANFYEQFGKNGFDDMTPEKMAFIATESVVFYEKYQRQNANGYKQYCARELVRFTKDLQEAIDITQSIAADRQVIEEYMAAGLALRKSRSMGRSESLEFLQAGEVYDFGIAAQKLSKPYIFEQTRGEFLIMEAARQKWEAKLLREFKIAFAKAETYDLLNEFLEEFGHTKFNSSPSDAYYASIARQRGGFEFLEVAPEMVDANINKLFQTIGSRTVESRREGGYDSATTNMQIFESDLKDAILKVDSIVTERRRVAALPVKGGLFKKLNNFTVKPEPQAKKAKAPCKPAEEQILVPTRITLKKVIGAQTAQSTTLNENRA